jgi:hypothetical protein
MARSMNTGETRNRHGKLATWWRHWRNRDAISGSGGCCDADAIEYLARVGEAKHREPDVLVGKWPADPICRSHLLEHCRPGALKP